MNRKNPQKTHHLAFYSKWTQIRTFATILVLYTKTSKDSRDFKSMKILYVLQWKFHSKLWKMSVNLAQNCSRVSLVGLPSLLNAWRTPLSQISLSISIYITPIFVLHFLCCFPRGVDAKLPTWVGRWKPATLTGASGWRLVLWTYTWKRETLWGGHVVPRLQSEWERARKKRETEKEREGERRPSTFLSGSFFRCPAPTCSCSSW